MRTLMSFQRKRCPQANFLPEDNDLNQMLDDHLGFVDTRFSVLVVALTFFSRLQPH